MDRRRKRGKENVEEDVVQHKRQRRKSDDVDDAVESEEALLELSSDSDDGVDDGRKSRKSKSDVSSSGDDDNDEEQFSESDDGDDEAQFEKGMTRISEVAENGVIEHIELINFMSHAHTTVELGPCTNFICGQNGAGKRYVEARTNEKKTEKRKRN
jgi:structural maintenance of chromosomes protein 6